MKMMHHGIVSLCLLVLPIHAEASPQTIQKQVVEASCGVCQFNMTGTKCALAIRLPQGPALWVSGFSIDQFGDAHAADGFCQTIRKAKVSGTIVKEEFKAQEFVLVGNTP